MKISELRQKLSERQASVGSWMLFPCPEVAEVLGSGKFDWVTVDLEHGSIGMEDLPNLFRALELHKLYRSHVYKVPILFLLDEHLI